jgi:hypothetical protein
MASINRLDDQTEENCLICTDCAAQIVVSYLGGTMYVCGHCVADLADAASGWELLVQHADDEQTWH